MVSQRVLHFHARVVALKKELLAATRQTVRTHRPPTAEQLAEWGHRVVNFWNENSLYFSSEMDYFDGNKRSAGPDVQHLHEELYNAYVNRDDPTALSKIIKQMKKDWNIRSGRSRSPRRMSMVLGYGVTTRTLPEKSSRRSRSRSR